MPEGNLQQDRPRQLALALPVDPRHGVEDFLVGASNELAYGLVESWPEWGGSTVLICGPEGCGKTHLAAIWATRAHAWRVTAAEVTGDRVAHLGSSGALVIEDCDSTQRDEAALFHLINAVQARRGHMLLTARTRPDSWGLATRDLLSRLRLATVAQIDPPDDALLRAVLVKHFLDRQLVVDTSVVESLLLRMERSFAAARHTVETLDRMALERGRRVTRAMVSELLSESSVAAAGT
jgi:chromosomal replication initiation ATPase DnaA